MSDFAERVIKAADEAADPVYEETMCDGAGCCGNLSGAVRAAVVAAFREAGTVCLPVTFTAMADEIEKG